jgi:hypothetical protein
LAYGYTLLLVHSNWPMRRVVSGANAHKGPPRRFFYVPSTHSNANYGMADDRNSVITGSSNQVDEDLGRSGTAARQGWSDPSSNPNKELSDLSAEVAEIKASLHQAARASTRAVN